MSVHDSDHPDARSRKVGKKQIQIATEYLWSSLSNGFLSVFGVIVVRDRARELRLSELSVSIGGMHYALRTIPSAGITLGGGRIRWALYRLRVHVYDLESLPPQTVARLVYAGSSGRWFDRPFGYAQLSHLRFARRGRLFSVHDGQSRAFVRQAKGNNLCLTVRARNYTDSVASRLKVLAASVASLLFRPNTVLLYEKESMRYEESGAAVFEALVDSGHRNVHFVLDSASIDKVPERYRSRVVKRFSFEHYYRFFCARTFIGTELVSHAIELRTIDRLLLYRLRRGRFVFVFLQHGVMYMVALDSTQRSFFRAGSDFPRQARIVCSSELEAKHFIELGGFRAEDIYTCGLPKLDRARRQPDADKILIMPTWRPWEQNLIRTNPTASDYYAMLLEIYESIPDSLRHKATILPHPLLRDSLGSTPLGSSLWESESYDSALSQGAMLITDYSSIAYDAFYRGANVAFWWKDKDTCMRHYGGHLMLDEHNACGPVCYDSAALRLAVESIYLKPQDPEFVRRYEQIVQYHDGHNTDRLLLLLERDRLV